MDRNQTVFLDIPEEVILGILDHLNLTDRKNVRLTCKRLYALCNVNRFCKDEKIIWSEDYGRLCNARPTSLTSCYRSHYNLKIDDRICKSLEPSLILPFFEKNGAKVRSLNISYHDSCHPAGLVESLIMHCEELGNLSLELRKAPVPGPDLFTHEQKMLVRPKVTSLKIYLRRDHLPSSYFRKIISAFPNIKHLKIEFPYFDKSDDDPVHLENIIDDIMKLSSQLESLDLQCMPYYLIEKRPEFFDTLPNLKSKLRVEFYDDYALGEKLISCFLNVTSIQLDCINSCQISLLLRNTALKHLKLYQIWNFTLTSEDFKALVSSQLETISFDDYDLSCDMQSSDFPLLPNRTVTDLSLILSQFQYESIPLLFCTFFVGLVHLNLDDTMSLTDQILQCIFQYQENLRSLYLGSCKKCTTDGIFGTEDGRFKYSINNLRKLEYLRICDLHVSSDFYSDDINEKAFILPRLKHVDIQLSLEDDDYQLLRLPPVIPVNIFESCSNLEVVTLIDQAIPSYENITWLFKNLKHLNYFTCSINNYYVHHDRKYVTYINSKYFSIKVSDLDDQCQSYYDEELERMVIRGEPIFGRRKRTLYAPKIGSNTKNFKIYIETRACDIP